ncbi:hypothetical protein KUTeg_013535 [Tegillarca granosa]|uniref:Sulfotransferase domain-containing protein n=1 Tax=Tegillarca granosa TaxID=220873 RepID=A0ABQ9ETZ1_TEGGR|nr:hypothetical protein KUTeg_013535 [Tegillarca granosa]
MPVVYLTDDGGARLRCLDIDGYIIPTFNIIPNHEQEYRSMPEWQARDDDLMVCAYPKSGTHWIWEVMCMLLQGNAKRIEGIKEACMLEGLAKKTFDEMKSPRIINTHIYFKHLPKDFLRRHCKIIYMVRNPKDVCVSFFNHHTKILEYEFDGTWENYVPRFLKGDVDYGSWFDYTLDWERSTRRKHGVSNTCCILRDNETVKRLAKFLEVDLDESVLKQIDEMCQFDKMKKEKNKNENPDEWKDKEPGMYRKGQVGDWKNWFTVAQSELFDSVYDQKMKNSKVTLRFT